MIKKMLIIILMISTSYNFSMNNETTRTKAKKRLSGKIEQNAQKNARRLQENMRMGEFRNTLQENNVSIMTPCSVDELLDSLEKNPFYKRLIFFLNKNGLIIQQINNPAFQILELSSEDPEQTTNSSDATEEPSS